MTTKFRLTKRKNSAKKRNEGGVEIKLEAAFPKRQKPHMIMVMIVITAVIMMIATVKLTLCDITHILFTKLKNTAGNVNNSLSDLKYLVTPFEAQKILMTPLNIFRPPTLHRYINMLGIFVNLVDWDQTKHCSQQIPAYIVPLNLLPQQVLPSNKAPLFWSEDEMSNNTIISNLRSF